MEAHVHPVLSPLQLSKYFIKRLAFSLNEGFDRRPKPSKKEIRTTSMPEMGIDVHAEQNPDNATQWRVEVTIELGESEDKSFPYRVACTVVGYFQVDKRMPRQEADDLAKVSGASILYSTLREIVANTTGRTEFPHLMLPTLSFLDLPELLEEAKPKKAAGKKARKSLPAGKKK
jgi:preprotein translocase subunit SecB